MTIDDLVLTVIVVKKIVEIVRGQNLAVAQLPKDDFIGSQDRQHVLIAVVVRVDDGERVLRVAVESSENHRAVAHRAGHRGRCVDRQRVRCLQFEDDEAGERAAVFDADDERVRFVLREKNPFDFVADRRVRIGLEFARQTARVDVEQAEGNASAVLLLAGHVDGRRMARRGGDRTFDRMQRRANRMIVGGPDLHGVRVDVRGHFVEEADEKVSVVGEEEMMAGAGRRDRQLRMQIARLEE